MFATLARFKNGDFSRGGRKGAKCELIHFLSPKRENTEQDMVPYFAPADTLPLSVRVAKRSGAYRELDL
jgi:hypothetical protein